MLFRDEVGTVEELIQKLQDNNLYLDKVKVGVVCFIFDKDNNLILNKRGLNARDEVGKIQAFGGSVNAGDGNLRNSLKRELEEEIGNMSEIEIRDFIGAQLDSKETNGEIVNWIILAYKGYLISGKLVNMETDKSDGFVVDKMENFLDKNLSKTAYNFIKLMVD